MVGFPEDARPQAELGVCGQLLTSAEVCGETQTKPGWGGTAEAGEMLQFPPSLPWRALQQKGRHFCPVMCWRGKRNHSHRLRGFWAQMVLCSLWSCQTHLLFHPRPHVTKEVNAALCWFSSPVTSHFWRPGPTGLCTFNHVPDLGILGKMGQ